MHTDVLVEKMLIAGDWVDAEEFFHVYNPENNEIIAKVPLASNKQMLLAIDKGHSVLKNHAAWPTHERIRILNNVANYIEENKEKYARTIATEGSKTIKEARGEVKRTIQTIKISAEEARRVNGETINFDQMEGSENRVGYHYRFPIGVIGAITPFNDPLNLVAHKIGPAIAAGNPIVVKPASVTPLSALLLAEAFVKSGLPKGYLSVLTGSGKDIGETLITHPNVKMISFTGGLETGEKIAKQAGLKKVNMELGSNSPVIVLNDANQSEAVAACVSGAFSAVGQNCIGVQRIYVEKESYNQFLTALVEETTKLKVGDKLLESTDMGPLINEREAKRVEAWVNDALYRGAKLHTGGKRTGAFYEPTILTDVPEGAKIAKEEIFGPVVLVFPVNNVEEAVARSNSVNYGLQAGVFTNNIDNAYYTIQNMAVGGIMVNDSSDYRIDAMPFGGIKGSGLGREGVRSAIEAMTEPKVVCFQLQKWL
ncbi:aldehyde dehydrogenase family protein [Evansella cellulosilytica]|uniref:3-sulfolactaldehyde dehydrogenase n=1 Tax=Evansella cellulosilytica (strain ATCC 21833 / DSM 2522 / FERM P-1141 / JCM 9156 / N-4) TaxID=649639 RepID=E6U1V1_EVAC2|nr:aldehyde dehydrogenase family protein [Evansella cellulosilytica]ADU31598.1 Aldehyde Dehydrogenase [Evansella cellulosilytica DSM 2522]